MNVVCILAGGVGNRFGSPLPKQYHLINGRPVIEYVIDAAMKSIADEVVVVSNVDMVDHLEDKYGIVAIPGGANRNRSIGKALDYIGEKMDCERLIIIDAVCPMIRSNLLDLYFHLLDEHDAVFTACAISASLARYDSEPVNRKEYLLIQSPDAYRFDVLKAHFDQNSPYTTPLHMLPRSASIKYYYDFKDYLKVEYPKDLAVAETLMRERERHMRFEAHMEDTVLELFAKLRKMDRQGTKHWERLIDQDIERLFDKWEIYEFTVNPDAYTGLVLECKSRRYGNVILKMYPPFFARRFIKETFVLSNLAFYPQAPLLDTDSTRNAMLLGRIVPGDYIVYEEDREGIERMFREMWEHRTRVSAVRAIPKEIKSVVDLTLDEYAIASTYEYHPELVKKLVDQAKRVYDQSFLDEERCLLHGDAYYKNALRSNDGIKVIDPVGYTDAFVFEYMPFLTYELVMHTKPEEYQVQYGKLLDFFGRFADTSRFNEAVFVFLVKQMVPSIYEANDGYRRADRYLRLIQTLFCDKNGELTLGTKR